MASSSGNISVDLPSLQQSTPAIPIAVNPWKTKLSAFLLASFCITTALIFHTDFSNQSQITSFLKNIALAGGFLFIVVNGAKKYSFDNIKK